MLTVICHLLEAALLQQHVLHLCSCGAVSVIYNFIY